MDPDPPIADPPSPAPAPARRPSAVVVEFREALGTFAVARGLLALFLLLGLAMTRERPDRDPNTRLWQAFPNSAFWDGLARWDSGWFMRVEQEGYGGPDGRTKAAFFPLYPYTTRAMSTITGNHWAAGLIVSNLGLLGALVFLGRIARDSGLDDDGARRLLAYTLAFPTSFYLSAYYSEGLFLLCATAAVSAYLRGRNLPAGLWGALACGTRHIGLAVFLACLIGAILRPRRPGGSSPAWLLLMPLGTLAFMAILYAQVGDPLAFVTSHGSWGRTSALPHQTLIHTLSWLDWSLPRDMMNTIDLMDALSAIAFLILPLFLIRRADPALPILGLLLILVPLASGSVKSMMRCECVAFPAFLVLARWSGRREVDRALIYGMGLLQGLLALQFANWYWVG